MNDDFKIRTNTDNHIILCNNMNRNAFTKRKTLLFLIMSNTSNIVVLFIVYDYEYKLYYKISIYLVNILKYFKHLLSKY